MRMFRFVLAAMSGCSDVQPHARLLPPPRWSRVCWPAVAAYRAIIILVMLLPLQDEEELEQEQGEEAEGLGSDEEGAEAMEEDGGMPGTDLAVYGA